MKKMKSLLCVLLVLAIMWAFAGCYVISGQKMDKVKGTYKLTNYTYTPEYERKPNYTPRTRNYIEDEEYKYEDYLIVTGGGRGYYVHKEANAPAYVKEITLSYEYSQEDSSKVEYVIYNDALSRGQTSGKNRLGVNGKTLNYSKAAFDYTQLFTKKAMRTEDIYVRWEKVDNATDLSYAKNQVGELKEYDYESFGVRGIYEINKSVEVETGTILESPYQYFFYVIDTAKGTTTVKCYYALKETPTTQETKSLSFSASADWSTLTIGDTLWTDCSYVYSVNNHYYESESDGIKTEIYCVSSDISDSSLEWLVESRLPYVEE